MMIQSVSYFPYKLPSRIGSPQTQMMRPYSNVSHRVDSIVLFGKTTPYYCQTSVYGSGDAINNCGLTTIRNALLHQGFRDDNNRVVEHYNGMIETLGAEKGLLKLTETQRKGLLAFLETLPSINKQNFAEAFNQQKIKKELIGDDSGLTAIGMGVFCAIHGLAPSLYYNLTRPNSATEVKAKLQSGKPAIVGDYTRHHSYLVYWRQNQYYRVDPFVGKPEQIKLHDLPLAHVAFIVLNKKPGPHLFRAVATPNQSPSRSIPLVNNPNRPKTFLNGFRQGITESGRPCLIAGGILSAIGLIPLLHPALLLAMAVFCLCPAYAVLRGLQEAFSK